jgi:hypothetical protein
MAILAAAVTLSEDASGKLAGGIANRGVFESGGQERLMAYDEDLAARVRRILTGRLEIEEKKMFGGLAFLVRGSMCCGVKDARLMARVGRSVYEQALSEDHVLPMDFTGRPLKGFVYVELAGVESDEALEWWIDRCLSYVLTLPPK